MCAVTLLTGRDAEILYHRHGEGPPVVLVQGVGVVGEGWRPQVEELAPAFSLITFDNRGMGGSSRGRALSVEAMAEDVLAIMDAEGVETAHVAGHSMGGLIAQQVALAAPGRVRSLALLCTFATGAQGARITPDILWTGIRTRVGTRRMRRQAFLELVMPEALLVQQDCDVLAERLRPLFGHDLADQPPVVMAQLAAMKRYDARSRLSGLPKTPTLIVSAALDRIARPTFGRELAACIPGAQFVEVEGAAHGLPIHAAAVVNAFLRDHWTRAETARLSASVPPVA